MPLEAIARTETIDFRLHAADIAAVLCQLARAEARPAPAVPDSLRAEAVLVENTMTQEEPSPSVGSETVLTCPDCGGTLWELRDGVHKRFRCRVGHAFSSGRLLEAIDTEIEQGLWVAARALRERADLLTARLRHGKCCAMAWSLMAVIASGAVCDPIGPRRCNLH